MRTRVTRALVLALLTALAILVPTAPASAHAVLKRTAPGAGAILDTAPATVTMTFTESVDLLPGKVTVIAPDGADARRAEPSTREGGAVVRIPLRDGLGRGTYVVSYRVVSADGHPISGGFVFSVGAPSARTDRSGPVETDGAAAVDPWVRGGQSVARYAGYAGLALLAGPMLVLVAFWPRRLPVAGPRRVAWVGLALLWGGTAVTFVLQGAYASGGTLADVPGGIAGAADTSVGRALLVRLVLLLGAAFVVARTTGRGRSGGADGVLGGVLAAAVLLTFPFAGHGASSPLPLLAIPALMVHVGAMAVWLGGLVMLARYLLPRADESELAAILPVWSRWATWAVVALVVSGTVEAVLEVGSLGALTRTTYGLLVLAKIVWLAAILVVAANARTWVRRRFALPVAHAYEIPDESDPEEPRTAARRVLRRRVVIELALAAVVLGLATALVQATPARTAADEAPTSTGLPYTATVRTDRFDLQIDLDPAATGNNSVHVTAFDRQGGPVRVAQWKGSASLAGAGIAGLDIVLLPITLNHAVGQVQLPRAGNWVFRFTVRTSDVDSTVVERTVRIR